MLRRVLGGLLHYFLIRGVHVLQEDFFIPYGACELCAHPRDKSSEKTRECACRCRWRVSIQK